MPTIAGCTVTLACGTVVNGQVRHLLGIVIDIGMLHSGLSHGKNQFA